MTVCRITFDLAVSDFSPPMIEIAKCLIDEMSGIPFILGAEAKQDTLAQAFVVSASRIIEDRLSKREDR